MANEKLIHAGLPWTNPQKITVKSDEYISEMVINRGLLNLLSNEYYLDLKTERINQYIQETIDVHIDDHSIHHTSGDIYNIVKKYIDGGGEEGGGTDVNPYANMCLTKNTTYLLPVFFKEDKITFDVQRTVEVGKQIINKTPHNLNGYSLAFAFTKVFPSTTGNFQNYEVLDLDEFFDLINAPIQMDIGNNVFSFEGFYGGTLIVMGNEMFGIDGSDDIKLQETMYSPLPRRYSRLLIEQFQKRLNSNIGNKYFRFFGSGGNPKYSVISFKNCNCDTFLWNVQVTNYSSSIPSGTEEDMPDVYDVNIFYPCSNNYYKKISSTNIDQLIPQYINQEVFENIATTNLYLNVCSSFISSSITPINSTFFTYTQLSGGYCYFDNIPTKEKTTENDFYISNIFRNTLYNNKKTDGIITAASGKTAQILFWFKLKDKDYTQVPILYDYDKNTGNGLYIGFEKVAVSNQGVVTEYETNFINDFKYYRKRDFWNLCELKIISHGDHRYYVNLNVIKESEDRISGIIDDLFPLNENTTQNTKYHPNDYDPKDDIQINFFNDLSNLKFFTNGIVNFQGGIKNLLFFNKELSYEEIQSIWKKECAVNSYLWSDEQTDEYDPNSTLFSSIYVYNTNLLNIINCDLVQ